MTKTEDRLYDEFESLTSRVQRTVASLIVSDNIDPDTNKVGIGSVVARKAAKDMERVAEILELSEQEGPSVSELVNQTITDIKTIDEGGTIKAHGQDLLASEAIRNIIIQRLTMIAEAYEGMEDDADD